MFHRRAFLACDVDKILMEVPLFQELSLPLKFIAVHLIFIFLSSYFVLTRKRNATQQIPIQIFISVLMGKY